MYYDRKFTESIRLKKDIKKIIPSGSSTLAKSPERLLEGYSPMYALSGDGGHFIDVDGNDWLDCEMAMGTVVWGYNRKEINDAIYEQLKQGINHSVPTILEYKLAKKLLERYPEYESVKFFKNGADAVYAGVRVSKAVTGRSKSLTCSSYHGWLDWTSYGYYNSDPEKMGMIPTTSDFNFFCTSYEEILCTLKKHYKEIACVVICPQSFSRDEIEDIMYFCRETSVIVLFDEVTSGIRYAYGGVAGAYGLYPDIICISKGMANGMPLAAILGKQKLILRMADLKISNAHAGEALSLAAAIACEELMSSCKIWPTWKYSAERIINKVCSLLEQLPDKCGLVVDGAANCFSVNTFGCTFLNNPFRSYLMKFFSHKGIFTKGYIIFCDAHTADETDYVEKCLCECIKTYSEQFNSL